MFTVPAADSDNLKEFVKQVEKHRLRPATQTVEAALALYNTYFEEGNAEGFNCEVVLKP